MIRVFKHHIPMSFVLLAIVEVLLVGLSIYAAAALLLADHPGNFVHDVRELLPKALAFSVIMLSGMASMGMYHRGYRDKADVMVLRILVSFVLGIIVLSLVSHIWPSLLLGPGVVVASLAFAFGAILFSRYVFFSLVDQRVLKRRVLVLGAGEQAKLLSELRRQTDRRGFDIVGFMHVRGQHDVLDPSQIIRIDGPLNEYADEHNIDEIVIAVDDRRKTLPVKEILECKMNGVRIIDLLGFFERETGRVRNDILHPGWMIFSDGFAQGSHRPYLKRAFDIAASLGLVLVSWPFMLVVAAAILVEAGFRGPVLYRQVRVGQGGERFELLKFRSMRPDAESDGVARWAQKNDDRVTRIGNFIRKTRLDELPQVFNVLRGDMSFVGPRPERPEFVVELDLKIPYYMERHRVKPGITGWAQIRYPYGASDRDATRKLQYDLYYVKNYSLFLDLMILLQTAEVVLFGKGAR